MSTEQNINKESKTSKNSKQEEEISIADILQLIWSNRYWFALSIILCIGIAFFYIQSTSKVYSRKATVLIRDDSKGGTYISIPPFNGRSCTSAAFRY